MLRNYDFYYNNLNINHGEVDRILRIINDFENGIYKEDEIRSLGADGLKLCICEGKYDVFEKLVSPFSYEDGEVIRYKYLLDAFSLEIDRFIRNCPSSIMEHWASVNEKLKYSLRDDEEFIPIPVEETSKDAIVLYPGLKERLLNSLFDLPKEKILTIKIKDVLPRQICGMGHPIMSVRDVVYYHEAPMVFAGLDLFNKNIITTANDTAGCYDEDFISPNLCLIIDYETLDDDNKMIADAMVENGNAEYQDESYAGKGKGLIINVPCSREESIYEVNLRMMKLVSMFHKQDMIYGHFTVDDFYNTISSWFFILTPDEQEKVNSILNNGYTSENILEVMKYFKWMFEGIYYDKDEDVFWISKYYYKKHREYLEEQPNFGSSLK